MRLFLRSPQRALTAYVTEPYHGSTRTLAENSPSRAWRRCLGRAALLLLLLLLLYLLYSGWQAYQRISALRARITTLPVVISSEPESIRRTLSGMQQDLTLLRRDLALPLAIAPHLGWIPRFGATITAVPGLLDSGETLVGIGLTIWMVVEQTLISALSGQLEWEDSFRATGTAVAAHETTLASAAVDGRRALTQLADVAAPKLIPILAEPLARLQPLIPLVSASLDALPRLPVLAGADHDAFYLLLAQNADELRPTGGFISSVGTLLMEGGTPRLGPFRDSYELEDWTQPHPDPPSALRETMGLDLWVTRDANWWPDFPTSAQAVIDLYQLNQGTRADGILAVDSIATVRLLESLAPLELRDGQRLERGQIETSLRENWSLPTDLLTTQGVTITASHPFTAIVVGLYYGQHRGDVWFDDVQLEALNNPGVNLVANPSFEESLDGRLPSGWEIGGLREQDGLTEHAAHSGRRSLYLAGAARTEKRATQLLDFGGEEGALFRLAAESRSAGGNVKGGVYVLSIAFLSADGPVQTSEAAFPAIAHDWATAGTSDLVDEWWLHRKDIVDDAVQAALAAVSTRPTELRWVDLFTTLTTLLNERHIQVYLTDPLAQAALQRNGWTGTLGQYASDYLLVVDSNVGYNKVSATVEQAIAYSVTLNPSGGAVGELTLRYENLSQPDGAPCDKFRQYIPTYAALTQGCYWDYVRIYAPRGAALVSARGFDGEVEVSEDAERAVFAGALTVPRGEKRELVLSYRLPDSTVRQGVYALDVQKQAGTRAIPLEIKINSESDLRPEGEDLHTTHQEDRRLIYRTDLTIDRSLQMRLSP